MDPFWILFWSIYRCFTYKNAVMIQFAKCLPEGNQSFATYRSPVGAQLGLRAKISAAASGKARGGTGWNWLSGFNSPTSWRRLWWYSGWKKSCTTLDGWNPLNNGIKHLSAGARFRNHPQYHGNYSGDILFHHGDIILCHMVITCNNSGITESPKSYDSFLCVWKWWMYHTMWAPPVISWLFAYHSP